MTNSRVVNSLIRNTGDDALAMWSQTSTAARIENANDVFDHNTVQNPVLANGIAVYGGRDNTVSNNVVADPVREGSGLHAGQRFGSTPFAGYLRFTNNTTVRAGTYELNWNIGLGAIWLYALEGSLTANIEVTGDNFLQSTYNAIMIVSDFPVKDLYTISNVHFKDIHVDGTGTSVLSARSAGSATFENVDARNVGAVGINNCGSFHFTPAGSEFSRHRPRRQRRRRHHRSVARAVGAAEHDHVRRPPAGRPAAAALGLVARELVERGKLRPSPRSLPGGTVTPRSSTTTNGNGTSGARGIKRLAGAHHRPRPGASVLLFVAAHARPAAHSSPPGHEHQGKRPRPLRPPVAYHQEARAAGARFPAILASVASLGDDDPERRRARRQRGRRRRQLGEAAAADREAGDRVRAGRRRPRASRRQARAARPQRPCR